MIPIFHGASGCDKSASQGFQLASSLSKRWVMRSHEQIITQSREASALRFSLSIAPAPVVRPLSC